MRYFRSSSTFLYFLGTALLLQAAPAAALPEPWAARAVEVEAVYKTYQERLGRFYASLNLLLKAEAPDLIPPSEKAPAPVVHGYQILPKIVPNAAPPAQRPRAEVRSFSWPWTRAMIGRESEKLAAVEADLARVQTAPAPDRRALYVKLAAAYAALPVGQVMIDNHIQYNRLWQNNIAANRAFYDAQTRLADAVVERQAIYDALAKPDAAGEALLRAREEALSRDIRAATDEVAPAAFVHVEHPAPHRWIVRVPFITDIEDEKFLSSFKSAVEETWRVTDGEDDYRAAVALTRVSPLSLYPAGPPKNGDPIDLAKHLALFPQGSAVLTTGAATTYVDSPRFIVIGANEIKPHDLAHEFGHILGFKDVYFRGYRDMGADGFDVQEIVAEPDDIMGAPGWGPVRKGHFARLIEALRPGSAGGPGKAKKS